jgi:hypothetical protein
MQSFPLHFAGVTCVTGSYERSRDLYRKYAKYKVFKEGESKSDVFQGALIKDRYRRDKSRILRPQMPLPSRSPSDLYPSTITVCQPIISNIDLEAPRTLDLTDACFRELRCTGPDLSARPLPSPPSI